MYILSFQVHQMIYVGSVSVIPLLFLLTEKGSALMNFWLNMFTIGKELGLQNKRFIIGEKVRLTLQITQGNTRLWVININFTNW